MNEFDNAYVIHFKVIGFCRTCLLVVFICCKGYFLFAQPADSLAVHTLINEMNILSAKFPFSRVYTDNRIRQNNLSASLRDQIHSNINSRPDNSILVPSRKDGRYLAKNRNESQRMLNSFCKDSSFVKLLSLDRAAIYVESVKQLEQGGALIAATMYDTARLPHPTWRSFGLIIKLNDAGDIQWIRQFEDLSSGDFSDFYMKRVFELSNHDIICVATLSNDNSDKYKTIIYRLSGNGTMIWKNVLKSSLNIDNNPTGSYNVWISSAADGTNGDVILCGASYSNISNAKLETLIRLDNAGNIVWDSNWGNSGNYEMGAEGVDAFLRNGQIILIGVSHGSGVPRDPPAINFFTIDYDSGSLLSKRFFKPSYEDALEELGKSFAYWDNNCAHLANGHILFYGKLFSDFGNLNTPADYFGVLEFDAGLNLVDAYTITSDLKSNFYNNFLHFDATGRGLITVMQYLDLHAANLFFGSFVDKQFHNQRRVSYQEVGLPGYSGFAFSADKSYSFVQSYFKEGLLSKSFIEYRKMHDSDTSSLCLGIDTLLFRFLPLHIVEDPTYSHIDPNIPNQIIPVSADITQTDTLSAVILEECNRLSYCDTVKIHGDTLVCGDTKIMTFTAFKNKECGAIVQWRLDNSIVDSMQTLSDSSVRIWFKNVTWNGKLYALIPTGTCSSIVIDSIELHVVKLQGKINLGEDTVLCPQNVYLLRAGHGYKSYLWIDGSTDSILLIKDPGTYFVEVTDYCGAKDADTIVVTAAPPIPFYIGPDLDVCAYSTTTISAPSGFLNYTWSPDYNIDKLTSPSVNISPLLDTTYYIKAEKTPGCFAYDTLHVRVHSSPSIKLGNDTSFCTGGSLLLNAGPGFTQTIWNTGETNQTIEVNQAGVYSVIGITANDCKSFDTLNVVNVWPIPLVDLGKDSTLCADTSRILTPGNFLSYLWQDGSTNSTYTVKNLGTYDVQVADIHGCRAKDSIIINTLLPYPSNFLLPFDSICSYDNLQLIPLKEYNRYLWSTGQETSSVFVGMPGMYTLKVTDDKGCSGSDSIMIYVKDCLKGFYIPSAFTPNNDKLNDTFKPSIGGILTEYEFTIYSRWGQIIFATKSINEAWNGTLNGIPQSSGLFIWTCVWQVEGNQSRLERGAVMLIR